MGGAERCFTINYLWYNGATFLSDLYFLPSSLSLSKRNEEVNFEKKKGTQLFEKNVPKFKTIPKKEHDLFNGSYREIWKVVLFENIASCV